MSVYNTTYNYNQGNMNFGQALLYGAFGSLTGGMGGCYGGGYGMGIGGFGMGMGGFGMGGSIFPMAGFGGFGMGYCTDQMVGAQIGLMGANVLTAMLTTHLDGKGGSKAESESLSAKITAKENEASSHLSTLGESTTLSNFNPNKPASEYKVVSDLSTTLQKADSNIKSELGKINEKLPKLEAQLSNKYPKGKPDTTNFPKLNENESDSAYEQRLSAAIKEYNDTKDEYNKLTSEKEQLTKKEDKSNPLVKAYIEAKEAKEAKEKEVQAAINALKPIQEEYKKLKSEQENIKRADLINENDGNTLTRASKKSIAKYSDENFDKNTTQLPTKAEVKRALYEYRKDNSSDNKKVLENMAKIKGAKATMKDYGFETIFKTLGITLEE